MIRLSVAILLCSASLFADDCVSYKDAAQLIGRTGCVSGKVEHVAHSQTGNTYLDFCADYRNCSFSAAVLHRASSKVGDLEELEGRTIELRGAVRDYKGKPEILITDRSQITVLPQKK